VGVEVAALYASLEANVMPLETALGEADALLKGVAEQAAVTTDVVADLGAGAGTAATGVAGVGVAAGEAAAGLTGMGEGASTASAGLAGVGEAAGVAAVATDAQAVSSKGLMSTMNGLIGPLLGVTIGVAAIKGAWDDAINSSLTLSDGVRRLGLDIGASAQDASKLIYAADAMGVSQDTLVRSLDLAINKMRSLHSEGIQPNIDGLGKLSDAYLSLAPGVERAQFLFDNFGRSGQQMGQLMALGSQGIKDLGDQASAMGVVLDGQTTGSMFKYEQETKAMGAAWLGLKIQVTETVMPPLMAAMQSSAGYAENLRVKNELLSDGAYGLSAHLNAEAVALEDVNRGMWGLSPAASAAANSFVETSESSDRAAAAMAAQSTATGFTGDLTSNAASIIAGYTGNVNLQATSQYNAKIATDAYNTALADQIGQYELSAGMAGNVTKAEESYGKLVEADAPKLAKLQAELAKYTDAQGTSIEIVTKGKYTAEQYSIAQERLQIAEERLAGTHSKSQATLDSLSLSVRVAQDNVDKMSGSLTTSATGAADNSAKIADLKAQIDPLVQAEATAKDAVDKATASLLFQSVSANLPIEASTKIAHSLGLISDADYALAVAGEVARAAYDKNIKGGMDASKALDILNGTLAATKYNSENASAVIPPLTGHIGEAGAQAAIASGQVKNLADYIENLHDKAVHIDVYTTDYHSQVTAPGGGVDSGARPTPPGRPPGGGAAAGGEFVVPAGYNENYRVGPYVASSGERVTITPQGQGRGGGGGGGNTYVTINDKLAASLYLENMRQQKLATMEARM
jgi:hypothetical protein